LVYPTRLIKVATTYYRQQTTQDSHKRTSPLTNSTRRQFSSKASSQLYANLHKQRRLKADFYGKTM